RARTVRDLQGKAWHRSFARFLVSASRGAAAGASRRRRRKRVRQTADPFASLDTIDTISKLGGTGDYNCPVRADRSNRTLFVWASAVDVLEPDDIILAQIGA